MLFQFLKTQLGISGHIHRLMAGSMAGLWLFSMTFFQDYIYSTFMHLADAFIQRVLQCIRFIHVLSVCVFPGNWTHNLCAANTMLYHWATGTDPCNLMISVMFLSALYSFCRDDCSYLHLSTRCYPSSLGISSDRRASLHWHTKRLSDYLP